MEMELYGCHVCPGGSETLEKFTIMYIHCMFAYIPYNNKRAFIVGICVRIGLSKECSF